MHDGMHYDPIKVKVTSPRKSEIQPFSNAIFSPIYNGGLANDHGFSHLGLWHNTWSLSGRIFYFCPSFCHVTLKLAVSMSRPSVPYGANFITVRINCKLNFLLGRIACKQCTYAAYCYRRRTQRGLYVCVVGIRLSYAKTAEPIEMPF